MAPATQPFKVSLVFGTRPEAIKMAPLIRELADSPRFHPAVIVTGQHREMLDQVLVLFDIHPAVDLNVITPRQSLTSITNAVLKGLESVLVDDSPDAIVVQGDTTSSMAAALAAFYAKIPVAHLEAGLRTGHRYAPFPEEINRRVTTQLASLHLAPTLKARQNLESEGMAPESIVVTGNTVIDALLWTVRRRVPYQDEVLEQIDKSNDRVILITAHRRESWGARMSGIASALRQLAEKYPDVALVVPMHSNPIVRETLVPLLHGRRNVHLIDSMSYGPFARLMSRATVLLTDSGGIQEEGPSLGKPVLVMRETTERPEAIDAGTARLVGTDPNAIVAAVSELLESPDAYARMARATNPYGDGKAAARCERALAHFLGDDSERIEEFRAG